MTDTQDTFEMLKAADKRRKTFAEANKPEPIKRYVNRLGRMSSSRSEFMKEVPEIDAFLTDIFEVFKKHGMSISHEDHHGGFEIENSVKDNEYNKDWLNQASDAREVLHEKSIFKA